jgi:dTDP-4-amino-4,6-dideoxygalactose transaminase
MNNMRSINRLLKVPLVDLSLQYRSIAPDIDQALSSVLQRADFILGQDVSLFEQEFSSYCGAAFAVGVDSGTSALELALRAFGVGPGDEVITAANSYIASALAISHVGATPVLVDADPKTYTIDVSAVGRVISSRTRAIIPIHLYGQPADMDAIVQIARDHELLVLEDACQAHGAIYRDHRVGSLGHAAAFSFYPGKNLGAYGDGGAVVTNDETIAKQVRKLRNYGQTGKYKHVIKGYNRRLDTLQAAVLRVKLPYLDTWNDARRKHAAHYSCFLTGAGVSTPYECTQGNSVWHLYVIRTTYRDELQVYLAERGIATGIHYPIPIHLQPAYSDLGYKPGSFPVAEQCARECLSLPMYAELTNTAIEYIADAIRQFHSGRQLYSSAA